MVLAHPDYSKVFEIYPDASSKQLGAVITQDNRPIAFFSWKLSIAQCKYSVTKIELLAIVRTINEFKGMLGANPQKCLLLQSICRQAKGQHEMTLERLTEYGFESFAH